VPKAFVVLRPGIDASAEVARSILEFCKARLAPYQRIRRLEFAELPKTISGKIRRVELRKREAEERGRESAARASSGPATCNLAPLALGSGLQASGKAPER
jgi:acetyl-CoA synthetase